MAVEKLKPLDDGCEDTAETDLVEDAELLSRLSCNVFSSGLRVCIY